MTLNYSKEITANSVQQVAMLKASNDKYLNKDTMVVVSFFDQLSGLDEETVSLLNTRLA